MLDPLLEQSAQHTPRALARARRRDPRTPTRFERWAWSPILAFRIGLTVGYLATVYFGVSAFIAGIPAFVITAPEGWTPIWATVLVIGGGVGAIGSVSDHKPWSRIELAGSWALFLTLGSYATVLLFLAYGNGDASRAAVGAGFVALGVQPAIRMVWLMSQLGRSK